MLSAENNLSGVGGAGAGSKSKRQAKREMEMNEYNQKRGGSGGESQAARERLE